MPGLVKTIKVETDVLTTGYVELPSGIWITDVHFTMAENADIAPIFVNAYIVDTKSGPPKDLDISLPKSFITRSDSTNPMDFSGGAEWYGSQWLPPEFPAYLHWNIVNETGTARKIRLAVTWSDKPGGSGFRTKEIKFTWPFGGTWAYYAVAKQTNAAGGTVFVDITPKLGTEMIVMYMKLGPDDYAAARTVSVQVVDGETTPKTISFWSTISMDNQAMYLPQVGTAETVNKSIDSTPLHARLISGSDQLRCALSSPVQNEELTIAIRARIRGFKPTVSKAKSSNAADVTLTETYNKVI